MIDTRDDGNDTLHGLESVRHTTRRHFLRECQTGIGKAALASLLLADGVLEARQSPGQRETSGDATGAPLDVRAPHFAPRARSVIYLHMAGSPPQHDLFDWKPELEKRNGQPCPQEYLEGERFAFIKGTPKLLASPHRFARRGQSGAWVSEILPCIARVADDIAFVKSMNTDQFNHAPAQLLLYTGSPRMGRPSMGAWVTYGLGSESRDLPGFVVLISGGVNPSAGKTAWGSGFLPSVFQGVQCRSRGDPVLFASNPRGMDRRMRRLSLDVLRELNELQARELGSPETLTRIAQYELAYRMQVSVPGAMDISQEPEQVRGLYGAMPGEASFANNCLLARRLVEKGVRFVQLFDWGWDFHGTGEGNDIKLALPGKCRDMDRAVAALITDLKQRGLLDETLVIWSGEFGRTPLNEERNGSKFLGRDHHPHCFTAFLAGGGVKPGITWGETDELGYRVARDRVHIHDLQATILHLLGLDHERLTYRFQGRDYRLTDVHGEVVGGLLA